MDLLAAFVMRYVRRHRQSRRATSDWLMTAQRHLHMAHDYATSAQPNRAERTAANIAHADRIVSLMVERLFWEGD